MDQSYEDSRKSNKPPSDPEPVTEVFPPEKEAPPVISLDITWASIARVFSTVALVFGIFLVWRVIIVVIFALLLVAAFNPLVRGLQAKLNRTWAVLAVMLTFIGIIVAILVFTVPSVISESQTLIRTAPQHVQKLQRLMNQRHIRLNVAEQVTRLSARFSNPVPELWAMMSDLIQGVGGIIVVLVLAIYLLIEGQKTGNSLARLLPREKRLGARRMVAEIGNQVGGYIRGQLIASALAGSFSAIVLLVLHVPQALALAAIAAFMDVVPFVGILVATLTAVGMAMTVSTKVALLVFGLYLVYHQVESHILIPQIYGNTLGLSFSVIVISVLVGAEVLGIVGAVLALPVAAAIPSIASYIQEWQEETPDLDLNGKGPGDGPGSGNGKEPEHGTGSENGRVPANGHKLP